MAEQQFISTGIEAMKLIIAGGIGGTIASCVGNYFVSKRLQAQKYQFDKELEAIKSEHGKKNTIHKLQFEKEFQLYNELWKALVAVRSSVVITPFFDYFPMDKSPYDIYKERFDIAVNDFNEANNVFQNHRPFYHNDVSNITGELLSKCREYIGDVNQMLQQKGEFPDELHDKADELLKKVPEAINEIEGAIKRRIGLLQEAKIVG